MLATGLPAVCAGPRNEHLARIGVNLTGNDFSTIRDDLEGHSLKRLDEGAPRRAKRACDGTREERWIGGSIPNVLRVGRWWVMPAGMWPPARRRDSATLSAMPSVWRKPLMRASPGAGRSMRHSPPMHGGATGWRCRAMNSHASTPLYPAAGDTQWVCHLA